MSVLKVKIEDGNTVVTVDDEPTPAITNVSLRCGEGKCALGFDGSPFRADLTSETAELEVTIPDNLGSALKA